MTRYYHNFPCSYFDYLTKMRIFEMEHVEDFTIAHELAAFLEDKGYSTYVHLGVIHARNDRWYIQVGKARIYIHRDMMSRIPIRPIYMTKQRRRSYADRVRLFDEVLTELRKVLSRDI